jgi:hypothetical protein
VCLAHGPSRLPCGPSVPLQEESVRCRYLLEVQTSDVRRSGTAANVYVTLVGDAAALGETTRVEGGGGMRGRGVAGSMHSSWAVLGEGAGWQAVQGCRPAVLLLCSHSRLCLPQAPTS